MPSTRFYGWPIEVVGDQPEITLHGGDPPQTFAAVTSRFSGSGDVFVEASSNRPAYLYVDYIRDA